MFATSTRMEKKKKKNKTTPPPTVDVIHNDVESSVVLLNLRRDKCKSK
jgi:hypothetical protein